ncbi:response regulator transcription factor [Paractinoplanes ferrugineus]|uniref:DNA-binding response regulator n=1 Tax=Paractinoplanes ferrugineus TaxID=113564 RepID=A0A919J520_9ACTN|nr:response regulator transcription factor [Actinoplanes ferrugineus]GIE10731.1 DNA-binding response regulator [Actinoplanes ferrugineus]
MTAPSPPTSAGGGTTKPGGATKDAGPTTPAGATTAAGASKPGEAAAGTPLRVVVVDDDHLMRIGLCSILSTDESLQVVAEAADGMQAVECAITYEPDVMLMDIRMPVLNGIEATRRIVEVAPRVRILILTTFEDDDYVLGALRSGAAGFALKRMRPEELIAAIHTVAGGDSLLAPRVTRTVIEQLSREAPPSELALDRLAQLTPRERDVLTLIARGLANTEIAQALNVEESTVKTHVKRIIAKLGLRDRIHGVILAYETGLIRPGDLPKA